MLGTIISRMGSTLISPVRIRKHDYKSCVSWPATTQLAPPKLVSKTVQKAGFAGFSNL
jgi:hypothetical protein